MTFIPYQHIERFGSSGVRGINIGECHIFYKLDGTNASVWLDNGEVKAGSRKRELSLDSDNQGFCETITKDESIIAYLDKYPNHRLYGEFLIPHTLKTYSDDAWRKFYIFDITTEDNGNIKYIPYDEYVQYLEQFNLNYIPRIKQITNPTKEQLEEILINSKGYLMNSAEDLHEGIVIKNYDFVNNYGNIVWAKMVTNEFKAKMGRNNPRQIIPGESTVEIDIANKLCTEEFIRKEYAKLCNLNGEWHQSLIPRLLDTIYHEFITEESWNIIKQFKNPTVNFRKLQTEINAKVKSTLVDIF